MVGLLLSVLQGISSSRYLLAESSTDVVPISSPLMPDLGSGRKTEKKGVASKPLKVQAIKKDVRQVCFLFHILFIRFMKVP